MKIVKIAGNFKEVIKHVLKPEAVAAAFLRDHEKDNTVVGKDLPRTVFIGEHQQQFIRHTEQWKQYPTGGYSQGLMESALIPAMFKMTSTQEYYDNHIKVTTEIDLVYYQDFGMSKFVRFAYLDDQDQCCGLALYFDKEHIEKKDRNTKKITKHPIPFKDPFHWTLCISRGTTKSFDEQQVFFYASEKTIAPLQETRPTGTTMITVAELNEELNHVIGSEYIAQFIVDFLREDGSLDYESHLLQLRQLSLKVGELTTLAIETNTDEKDSSASSSPRRLGSR